MQKKVREIINFFIICYILLFPLWLGKGGFTDIQETKISFFWVFMKIVFAFCILVILFGVIFNHNILLEIFENTDLILIVGLFLMNMLIAWFVNGRNTAFILGDTGRGFGMLAWFCILVVFVFFSSTAQESKYVDFFFVIPVFIVSVVAYLNFLGYNVFYASVVDIRKSIHISTIGNIDLLSAYLGMTAAFILGVVVFSAKKSLYKVCYVIVFFLEMAAMVSSNSDTGYLVCGVIFILIPFLIDQESELLWYINSLVAFAAAGLFVVFTRYIKGRSVCRITYGLAAVHADVKCCMLLIMFCVICYMLIYFTKKMGATIKRTIIGVRIFILLCVLVLVLSIILANNIYTGEIVQSHLGFLKKYIVFSNKWGTGRIGLWRSAIELFENMPGIQKMLGYGVSGYYEASLKYISQETMDTLWKDSRIVDPHNMLLQSLINFGMIGTTIYMVLLGYCTAFFAKKTKIEKANLAFVLFIIAYVLQGSVNYFHMFIEPIFFIWIAYGIAKNNKRM